MFYDLLFILIVPINAYVTDSDAHKALQHNDRVHFMNSELDSKMIFVTFFMMYRWWLVTSFEDFCFICHDKNIAKR